MTQQSDAEDGKDVKPAMEIDFQPALILEFACGEKVHVRPLRWSSPTSSRDG
jgi:hypothetical protein